MLSWVRNKLVLFGIENNLKRLLRNAAIALSGNMGSAIINLVTMSVVARALGATDFGILVLITTLILLIDSIVNFQSWQAIIKHGTEFIEKKENNKLANLLVFGFKLDILTAIFGFLLANFVIYITTYFYNEHHAYSYLAHIYSLSILFNIKGTPIAILRGFDRFSRFANQQITLSIIKLFLVGAGLCVSNQLATVVIMWLTAELIGRTLLVLYSLHELKIQKVNLDWYYPIKSAGKDYIGIWKFLISSNLNSSLRLGSREVDVFIVGAFLSTADVGVYKVAKQFSGIVGKVVDPLYQAVYPELVELVNKSNLELLKKFLLKVTSAAIGISLLIWVLSYILTPFAITYSVGKEFSDAYFVIVTYMLAVIISSSGFTLQPMMLAFGKPELSLKINVISTISYLAFLIIVIPGYGLVGAAFSYILYYIIWTILMCLFIRVEFNKMSYYAK